VIKEGLVPAEPSEKGNIDGILDVCLFPSLNTGDGYISLKEYVDSMKEGQTYIYYITGRKLSVLRSSPLLERCRELGWDVLLLADPVDEIIAPSLPSFEGNEFRSLEREDALEGTDLSTVDGEKTEGVAGFLKEILSDFVKDVRISSRLTDSPACLVNDREGGSFAMEQILRSMGQEVPLMKRIMEINPEHPVISGLQRLLDSGENEGNMKEYALLLHDQCILAEG